jgi:hypothetical protein
MVSSSMKLTVVTVQNWPVCARSMLNLPMSGLQFRTFAFFPVSGHSQLLYWSNESVIPTLDFLCLFIGSKFVYLKNKQSRYGD